MTSTTTAPPVAGVPTTRPGSPALRRGHTRDRLTGIVMVLPNLIGFGIFVLIPAVAGVALSLLDWDLVDPPIWVALDNYQRLVQDPQVWKALLVSVEFVAFGVAPAVLISFMLANLLDSRVRMIRLWRSLVFLPMVASAAVVAVIAGQLFRRGGVADSVLGWIGISSPDWFNSSGWAPIALIVILVWSSLPLTTMIYLAALQRIPDDLFAAAAIDGAGPTRTMWSITWPAVRAATLLVGFLQFLGFISGSLALSRILTDGNPLGSTRTLALYSYQVAFDRGDMGYASAIAVFQLLIVAAAVLIVRLLGRFRR
ncbi:carbohydrate ABC transporter permease [Nakamurella lactea]|uniref:carbohydrate ABC transporter permease n=1 Tax=Nakamurella lactea TaxID=459515 RepID=UPI0004920DC5|nr:sugar ABC transporter permease [Nakamurella lactea]